MKTYIEAIKNTASRLQTAGIEAVRTEAELIVCELSDCPRTKLFMRYQEPVPAVMLDQLETVVSRREKREPLQYILGHAYFMNLDLKVTPDVLIPRPETELMVERICRKTPQNAQTLDIGTGSGAVALAIAFERPDLQVTAVDVSLEALKIAEYNRKKYKLGNVKLLQSDLFSNLGRQRFDCIAANLPYVSENEYAELMPEVRDFEPILALTAPQDGLGIIFECIKKAPQYMNKGGLIVFEMGIEQAATIKETLAVTGKFINIKVIQDYSRRDRFVSAELN
jgi:release factor glutamine methyltransferase